MDFSAKHKWTSIGLLSIILPVSLLVTFRLTGIIPEPQTPETVVVEMKNWNGKRTSMAYTFNEWVDNYYYDNVASVGLQVGVGTYHNGSLGGGWGWTIYDYLNLKIIATANTSEGFIHSMTVEFSKGSDYTSGIAIIKDNDALFVLHNLTLQKVCDSWAGTREAYLVTVGDNKPKKCQLISNIDWIFFNQNIDDNVTVTLKTTYFNGTAYRKVVTPLYFLIRTDAGSNFETAKAVALGCYHGYLSSLQDSEDYYTVFLGANQTIYTMVKSSFSLNTDLYLYDPNQNLLANSSFGGEGGVEEAILKSWIDWAVSNSPCCISWEWVVHTFSDSIESIDNT